MSIQRPRQNPSPAGGRATALGAVLLALACQTTALAAAANNHVTPGWQDPANTLSPAQLQEHAMTLGITQVKEMKTRGSLAEIEGYDSQHREVDLTLDRRNGEVLYRGFDDYPNPPMQITATTLSLPQLEQHVTAQGIQVKEMKIKGLLLKVEGYDTLHREVDMTLDRRTGDVLYRGFDD